ncbi:hypothetical protein FD08_GL001843 [Lentilactobacillus parakefiri DSM 10551]|nr:hypothetical protein FD08_GL001843 [Lentilactobacillus parakefiri DSM 10551]
MYPGLAAAVVVFVVDEIEFAETGKPVAVKTPNVTNASNNNFFMMFSSYVLAN